MDTCFFSFFFLRNAIYDKNMLGLSYSRNCLENRAIFSFYGVLLSWRDVTPEFPKKTKCISYVGQDQVYTHMIDVMSEISININKNVQELNHYIISLLHSDVRLKGLYNDQTITMKTQLHLHLPQASDWGHASLRTPRSRWSTLFQCYPLNSG
jgi:hypothetical protein